MARRKKNNGFNWVVAALAVGVFAWIGMDFYFNFYRHPREKVEVEIVADDPAQNDEVLPPENDAPALEDGFVLAVWRDDRYGAEFQYPTVAGDARCLSPQKTEDGFSLGQFYFFAADAGEEMEDFMARQLQGMEIQKRDNITVADAMATKVDYQTPGMGRYGSSVFLENGGRAFEFGLLAGEAGEKCGGAPDYDDRLYQSAIATLKFAN